MSMFSTAARPRVIVARPTPPPARTAPGTPRGSSVDRGTGIAPVRRDLALADMLDRAGAQLTVLRSTLDEAVRMESAAAQRVDDLAGRLDQGGRLLEEFDRRLASAGRAASAVEQAGTALRELERVLTSVRALHDHAEQRFAERLAAATAGIESKLELELNAALSRALQKAAASEASFASTIDSLEQRARAQSLDTLLDQQRTHYQTLLDQQRAAFETRMAEMESRIADASQRLNAGHQTLGEQVARAWSGIERQLTDRAEALSARLDRETAAAQARTSLVLDSASDRLSVLERQGATLAGEVADRAEAMCRRAERVLGLDPHSGAPSANTDDQSVPGALAAIHEALARGERVRAALTIGVEQAEAHRDQLADACRAADGATNTQRDELDRLHAALRATQDQIAALDGRLAQADDACRLAEQAMALASDRMSTTRDDLDTIAAAARYHVEQVQGATSRLRASMDEARDAADQARAEGEQARVRSDSLRRSMEEMTAQAEALVSLARDVTALVNQQRPSTTEGSSLAPGTTGRLAG